MIPTLFRLLSAGCEKFIHRALFFGNQLSSFLLLLAVWRLRALLIDSSLGVSTSRVSQCYLREHNMLLIFVSNVGSVSLSAHLQTS